MAKNTDQKIKELLQDDSLSFDIIALKCGVSTEKVKRVYKLTGESL